MSAAYHPMVAECDGHIFTDYREGHHRDVDVYREPWMKSNCVVVRGDKGQVADLMRKPVLLFDDKEENIDLLRSRSSSDRPLDGVLVRRGRNVGRPVPPGYLCENDPREWVQICRRFGSAYSSDVTGDGPGTDFGSPSLVESSTLSWAGMIARQLVEEAHGGMKIEGAEHNIGKPTSTGTRRGVALAPVLSRRATSKLAQETDILKQRRKAREEATASKPGNN